MSIHVELDWVHMRRALELGKATMHLRELLSGGQRVQVWSISHTIAKKEHESTGAHV